TAVLSPVPHPVFDRSDIIKYDRISPDDFANPAFRDDYVRALSVTMNPFLPDRGREKPILADSLYGPFVVFAEVLLCILLFFLFLAGVWRKFGNKTG
ncbi:MAG: hypothetical protein L0213_00750, partial [Candidatus Dadabacteria bacterium]|nr:hypothetical protein [Candidatus Dadabacteria bacterium]